MASLPYIQLSVADYLADTMHLTTEEHGAYLLIIMNYWQRGGAVPKKTLASVARLSNDRWISVEVSLKDFFNETEDGLWIHKRIERDLRKIRTKRAQSVAAGKRSAEKRAAAREGENKGSVNGRCNSVATKGQRTANIKEKDKDKEKEKEKEKDKDCLSESGGYPSVEEVNLFAAELDLDLTGFFVFYEKSGWRISGEPIRRWKALARSWSKRQKSFAVDGVEAFPPGGDDDLDWAENLGT